MESSQASGTRNPESAAAAAGGGGHPVQTSASYSRTSASPSVSIYATTRRPGRSSQLARSSSEEEDQSTADAATSGVPHRGSTSNRGSIYASGTQSAYGSRDASPDKAGQTILGGVGGLGMRRISPYPAAPPSMIITPSHTPHRAMSVERGDLLTSDDIQKLYAKLDAIGSQNTHDSSTSSSAAAAAGGLTRRVTLIKSASIDVAEGMGSGAPNRSLGSYGVGYTRLDPTTAAAPPSPSRPTAIPETRTSRSSATGATSTSGNSTVAPPPTVGTKKCLDKRSASVSPRTARKQFYEDYPYDPKPNAAPTFVRESGSTTSVSGKNIENQTEAASATWHGVTSTSSSSDDNSKTTSAPSSSSLKQFFQNVKDKRKLFGSKKSMSVDSSVTHVSIARIGANVLSEPAAPSTYQPPEMTIPDQKKKYSKGSGSIDFPGTVFTTPTAKDKDKTSKEGQRKVHY